ncbi:large ribosomal RNA subunit accumulation protein YCED homolog 2, chloroplastic [Mercurialis annua]|uniref:large ribosomal RNA subunit accumulation protein YCED homolog 2, chloroplastic n=1 Tax=Mercurialis annua TaxID=3986 RepID=UPI0021608309|nr:large ribosomal RNA subunit accumulation protein YCED homolog 2, chloroplastic [Mercurialis annua]
MGEAGHLISKTLSSRLPSSKLVSHPSRNVTVTVTVARRKDFTMKTKKNPRRLITISTGDSKWHGKWNCDYLISLRDLNLEDLIEEDEQKDAEVSVNLSIQKHASFGFSVDGRIVTSFTRKCSNCSSPYCRQIDTSFNVWVLPSNNKHNGDELQLPEIGGDDPSVIYVKPGSEANLDSLVQDTIRLTTSVKDSCSESCEKSEPKLHYIGRQNAASIDKRWSRLLELKRVIS